MAHSQTFEAAARGIETETASVRWIQLLLGFIVMMTISSPQYVWTLFVPSFQKTTGSILSEVQWTITFLTSCRLGYRRCKDTSSSGSGPKS